MGSKFKMILKGLRFKATDGVKKCDNASYECPAHKSDFKSDNGK